MNAVDVARVEGGHGQTERVVYESVGSDSPGPAVEVDSVHPGATGAVLWIERAWTRVAHVARR